jgi:hypothetical protein
MSTVEYADLACSVRSNVLNEFHIKSSGSQWKLFLNRTGSFNDPEVERLSLDYQLIFVSNFLVDLINIFPWKTWYDPVDEGITKSVINIHPFHKIFWKVPEIRVL